MCTKKVVYIYIKNVHVITQKYGFNLKMICQNNDTYIF